MFLLTKLKPKPFVRHQNHNASDLYSFIHSYSLSHMLWLLRTISILGTI